MGQLKKPHLPDLSVLDIPKKKTDKSKTKNAPRNRVEAVRDALDEGDVEGDDEGNDDFDGGGGEVKPPEDFPGMVTIAIYSDSFYLSCPLGPSEVYSDLQLFFVYNYRM